MVDGCYYLPQPTAEYSKPFYESGAWRRRTTLDDLHDQARVQPSTPAIVNHYSSGEPQYTLTWGELDDAVRRAALGLVDLGVARGEVVAFQLPNWWQFSVIYFACVQVGAIALPIMPIMRKREVGQALAVVGSRVFIVPARYRHYDYVGMALELRDSLNALEHVFVIGEGDPPEGAKSFASYFLERDADTERYAELDQRAAKPDEIAVVKFTSGTTGEAKGVLHTHNTLFATTRAIPELMQLDSSDVVVMPSPLVHMSGFLYGLLMPMTWGMKAVYQDVWDGPTMLKLINQEGATWTMGATPYVIDLLETLRAEQTTLRGFKFSCSGAPIPRHLTASAEKVGVHLRPAWGLTEAGAVSFVAMSDPLEKAENTDGKASPWMEIKVSGDDGNTLPAGEEGALLIRGASRCLGYFDRPELTAAAIDDNGWLDTGDRGSLDDDGYVRVTGRDKDIIIRGGENVPVVEIENALYKHENVREVSIIGYPDSRLGERCLAIVVPQGNPPTLPELLAHLEALGVAKHYWPERLEIVSEMPRTDSGKIQKFRLRRQFAAVSEVGVEK